MSVSTLSSGSRTVPYMAMTSQALSCPPPVLAGDLDRCRVPGGVDLWARGGFYSPGRCFVGYTPLCKQTAGPSSGWPLRAGETAARCVPEHFECNDEARDQRYATASFAGTVLSVPAFEIRWRGGDGETDRDRAGPGGGGGGGSTSARTSRPLPSRTVTMPAATAPPGLPSPSSSSGGGGPSSTAASGSESQSPGAVAAIAVGTSLGVLVVVLAAVLCALGRLLKASKAARLPQGAPALGHGGGTAGSAAPGPAAQQQQQQQQPAELEHSPMVASELAAAASSSGPARGAVFEMAAEPVAAQPKQRQAE